MDIDDFAARFDEEPGYLDFARVGPIGRTVQEETAAQVGLLTHARFGSLDELLTGQDERSRRAIGALVGRDADHVVFQPNTSQGLMHAMFGITGGVLLSPAEFPSLPFAATRAAQSLGALEPRWLEAEHGKITPGTIREQLDDDVAAVAVSLVDYRTGYLIDLEGIRQVIGDRLLVVDAIQGFGVVDAPYEVADVVASGGQKWVRAGWGTGFLALSDRAVERLAPVWSGFNATGDGEMPVDEVPDPERSAKAFQVSNPDPVGQARMSAALEEIASVGVAAISARVAEGVSRVIDLADEFAIPISSPRAVAERAGIAVLRPEPEELTVLAAALHNHGVTVTGRDGAIRVSVHASTTEETLGMLRAAFVSFATAAGR